MSLRKLILVIDEDVCGFIKFYDEFPKNDTLADNFINNPTIMEVPVDVDIMRGWKYTPELGFYDPNE
jgi:hypothetical protein